MQKLFALCLVLTATILPVVSYAFSFQYEVTGVFDSDSGPLGGESFSAFFTYSDTGDEFDQQSPAGLTTPVALAFRDPAADLTIDVALQIFAGDATGEIELQIRLVFDQPITLNRRLPLPALFHGEVLLKEQGEPQGEPLGGVHPVDSSMVRDLTIIPEPGPILLLSSGVSILLLSGYLRRR